MKKGFSLVEIMVVIVITGILAAVAVPKLFGQLENSRIANDIQVLSAINTAVTAVAVNDEFRNAFNSTIENSARVFRIRLTWTAANASNPKYAFHRMILDAIKSNVGSEYVKVGSENSKEKIPFYKSDLLRKKNLDLMILVVESNGHYKICVLPTDSKGQDNPVKVYSYRGKPVAVGDVPKNGERWNGVSFKYFALE